MGKYFGTDGFRGEANVNLTADQAYQVGRFLGHHFSSGAKPAKILIGKDTRRSSYMFEYALSAGITASGGDAYLLHVTTTPSVAYITRTDDFDCGVMISASHNPFYDNGIKLLNSNGEKMEESTLSLVEEYLDGKREIPFAVGAAIGRTVDYVSGRNRYIGYLISLGKYSFKGMKVGLDCSNGAAFTIAKSVFDALGAKTYMLSDDPNGTNINEGCGSTHPEKLQELVVSQGLDVGFAYDGDADRCIAVDENGQLFDGDHILYALGKYLHSQNLLPAKTVVTTIMSNLGLYKALDKAGLTYAKTQVGDKYVYEYMVQQGCSLGGEQSGHIILSKYATTGDGILTSLMLMECMLAQKKTLSQLKEGLKIYPQVLKNVRVQDKEQALNSPAVLKAVEEAEQILGDNGRILVRKSGTEPLIRVMVEADQLETCETLATAVTTALQSCT